MVCKRPDLFIAVDRQIIDIINRVHHHGGWIVNIGQVSRFADILRTAFKVVPAVPFIARFYLIHLYPLGDEAFRSLPAHSGVLLVIADRHP